MIVWLASYPRSGNTFLRILLKSVFGIETYSKHNDLTDIGADEAFSELVGHRVYDGDWDSFKAAKSISETMTFIKTHDAPEDDGKAIYIVRDGRAAAWSFKRYLDSHSSLDFTLEDVVLGTVPFGSWDQHLRNWSPERRDKTLLLKFEDLTTAPIGAIREIAEFLGRDLLDGFEDDGSGRIPAFEALQAKHPDFFRSGSNSANLNDIPDDARQLMLKHFGEELQQWHYVQRSDYDEETAERLEQAHQAKLLKGKRELARAKEEAGKSSRTALRNDPSEKTGPHFSEEDLDALSSALEARLTQSAKRTEEALADNLSALQASLLSSLENSTGKALARFQESLDDRLTRMEDRIASAEQLIGKADESHDARKVELTGAIDHMKASLAEETQATITSLRASLDKLEKSAEQNAKTSNRLMKSVVDLPAIKSSVRQIAALDRKIERLSTKIDSVSPTQVLNRLQSRLADMSALLPKLSESQDAREAFAQVTASYVAELEHKNRFLINALLESENKGVSDAQKADRLQMSVRRLSSEHDAMLARLGEYEQVLQPRLRTLLEMRPLRHILDRRRMVKQGLVSSDPDYPTAGELVNRSEESAKSSAARERLTLSDVTALYPSFDAKPLTAPRRVATMGQASELSAHVPTSVSLPAKREPLGVAVFTFDRQDLVHNVLESLAQQNAIGRTHVFIDGDQGKPTKRALLDKTEALVQTYDVKQIHRYRGNYGFRKMMLTAQRKMMERYEKIVFLEDDCFPTHNAIEQFSRELDTIADKPDIFSVYGHPFLVPGEDKPFGRFQGWGWATTAEKLKPVWEELIRLYLMTEDEYKAWVEETLTPEVRAAIDITPGRQPTDTVTKFFAWDETLTLICGARGLKHKRTDQRLVYNCGVGGSSAHFTKIDYYRKPPFNMVHPDHVWDHF